MDIQEDKAFLLANKSVGKRGYDIDTSKEFGFSETRWGICTLRKWLNKNFLKRFSKSEREMIVQTIVEEPLRRSSPVNPEIIWTAAPEYDLFFILSYSEAKKYNVSFMEKDGKVWLRLGNGAHLSRDDGKNIVVEYYSKSSEGGRAYSTAFNARFEVYPAFWLSLGSK